MINLFSIKKTLNLHSVNNTLSNRYEKYNNFNIV